MTNEERRAAWAEIVEKIKALEAGQLELGMLIGISARYDFEKAKADA